MIFAMPRTLLRKLIRDALLRRLVRNASYLVSGNAGASFLALIALAMTARALGPEALGILALIQAYVAMVDRARLECWPALIKYGAESLEHERADDFKSLIKFGFLLDIGSALFATVIALVGLLVASWWFEWSPETIQMGALFSLCIVVRTSSMPQAVLRLFNRFWLDATLDIVGGIARVAVVGIAYLAGAGLWTFVLITMGSQVLNSLALTISGWVVLRREGYRGVMTSSCSGITQRCPGIWGFIWSLNASNIARRSTRELDLLFIGGVLGPAAASLYHVSKKLGEVLMLAAVPVQQAIYPELARLWTRGEKARFRRTTLQVDLATGALGVACLPIVVLYPELLITIAVGPEFTQAAWPLILQTVSVCLYLCGTALQPALFSMGMQMKYLTITTVSTICFYLAMLIAVPMIGISGGALAHIAHNVVFLVAVWAVLHHGLRATADSPAVELKESVPSRPA